MTNEQKARRIDSLEIIITGAGQTAHDVLQAQAERTRLLREVPEHVMKAFRDGKRANGVRSSERGINYDQAQIMEVTISGLEARTFPAAMHQLAAKRAEEWERQEKERKKKDKAAALLQWAAVAFLRQEERKRKCESE